MRRLITVIILVSALIVVGIVYHRPILTAIEFLYNRPYRELSDEELDRRITEVEARISAIDSKLSGVPSDPRSRSFSDLAGARDLRSMMKEPLALRRGLLAEKRWRSRRIDYLFLAGLIISTLVFLEVNRRVILHRDPSVRRRRKFDRKLDVELDRESREQDAARIRAELRKVDPRLSRLVPGSSSKKDVTNLLGDPDERTLFLEMEAWIYHLPPEKLAAGPDERRQPVTVLFKGGTVRDLSIGSVKDKETTPRSL
jgi:hypothetical protein